MFLESKIAIGTASFFGGIVAGFVIARITYNKTIKKGKMVTDLEDMVVDISKTDKAKAKVETEEVETEEAEEKTEEEPKSKKKKKKPVVEDEE